MYKTSTYIIKTLSLLLCIMILTCCADEPSTPSGAIYTGTSKLSEESAYTIMNPDEPGTDVKTDAEIKSAATEISEDNTSEAEKGTSEDTQKKETVPDTSNITSDDESVSSEENTSAVSEPLSLPEMIIKNMSTEELVGQMFLARHPWTESEAIADIRNYHLGGYILFAKDFDGKTPETVRKMLNRYQDTADIPMLFSVDEEGGNVTRISRFPAFRSTPFPSVRSLYTSGGLQEIIKIENEKAELLYSLGINVNMAPVCDITTNEKAFMYSRSLGQSPMITAIFAESVININRQNNVGCVLKHFPGYGNNTDTHTGIAIDNRSLDSLLACDLVPFQAGINFGCDAILVSHTIITAIDDKNPAALSEPLHRLLRENMGFGGVIVTDDLSMKAITEKYGAEEAAVMAVMAGNDLLCCTDYAVQYSAVLNAVKSGQISVSSVRQSVIRVLQWKDKLSILK